MKNDVLVAILIGFLIGGSVAIGITYLPNILKNAPKTRSEKIALSVSPSPQIESKNTTDTILVTVDKPENEKIIDTSSVTVTGKTNQGNTIFLDTDAETQIATVSGDGTFSSNINLNEGINNIIITAYSSNGDSLEKNLVLYYTPEKL